MPNQPNQNQQEISWQAPDFISAQKNLGWHIAFAIIGLMLLAYGIYTKSVITVITFILIIVVGYAFALKNPKIITYKLTRTGVSAGDSVYPYKTIKKFWIIYNSEAKTLNLETTAYLNHTISMQLGRQDPVAVKLFLKNYLPEDLNKEEDLSDVLARKLKF